MAGRVCTRVAGSHISQSTRHEIHFIALRALAVLVGIFFLAMGLNKLDWLFESGLLAQRFARWLPDAAPYARWYLEAIAIPGAPVFARLVPLGELSVAIALMIGFRIRLAASVALGMVVNFHVATSAFSSWDFLRDGTGLPVIGALATLAMAGNGLPLSIGWPATVKERVVHAYTRSGVRT